ncbi:hypothetical protein AAVH_13586, partial [Aphelenchoides avenae]
SDPEDQHYYRLDSYADLAKTFPKILLNTTCHVSAAVSEDTHDVRKSVDQCESALFRVAANRSTGITLKLRPTQGHADMYISLTNEEPNEHDNDGHVEAYEGHPGELRVSPAQLKRSGHVFLRLAAQSNDNDQEAEVFTRIVGRAAKNDFALHVDQGNTIQPPPIIDISHVGYRNSTKYGRLAGRLNYDHAEEACLHYHGSIPPMADENNAMYLASALLTVPELRTTGRTWIFKGDSRHDGPKCHALDICKAEIVERDCSEELVSICEVPRKGVCDGKDEHYFNGHCYRFIADGKTDAEAKDACKALSNGFELALARTDEEIHYARQLVNEYYVKARLGNHKGDDTPYGKTDCDRGEYPWCKENPKCDSATNDVTLNPSYEGGCFDSVGPDEKHPVLCQRAVAETVGPGQASLLLP